MNETIDGACRSATCADERATACAEPLLAPADHNNCPSQLAEAELAARSRCMECKLHGVMVCSNIPFETFAELQTRVDPLTLRRGDMLFQADLPAARVYFVRAGFVKLVKYSSSGGQRIVRIVKAGGVAGMEAALSSSYEHTAIAMGEVLVCSIPAASFRRMLDAHPLLQRRLFEYAHQALTEAETWLSELAGGNAHTHARLARLLLCLRDNGSERIHRFSLEDMGAILGVCVETVCRILAKFRRAGLLTKNRRYATGPEMPFYHADIAGLEEIAGPGGEPATRGAAV